MLIQVLQSHIDSAKQRICHDCVIAKAVQAVLNDKYTAAVGATQLQIFEVEAYENRYNYAAYPPKYTTDLPGEISKYIWDFDNGRRVKPTSFEVDIPSEYLKEQ